jgi:ribonuclease HI
MLSGQVYLAGCLNLIRRLATRGIGTEFRWIPAHEEVIGNEIVDQHAKDAAQEPVGLQNPLNRCFRLATAAKRRNSREAKLSAGLTALPHRSIYLE